MPIYEYQCKACGKQVETFQKMSEAPLTVCPHCQAEALTKLISATSFQLKGTGWYVTDIRDKNKPKETPKNDTTAKTADQPVASKTSSEAKTKDSGDASKTSSSNTKAAE